MAYKREESFVFSFWNYGTMKQQGVTEVARWKDLGMNVAMMPWGGSEAEIEEELKRQQTTIELIASENFTSEAVMAACGTVLTNKYAEGKPHKRYYTDVMLVCQHFFYNFFKNFSRKFLGL